MRALAVILALMTAAVAQSAAACSYVTWGEDGAITFEEHQRQSIEEANIIFVGQVSVLRELPPVLDIEVTYLTLAPISGGDAVPDTW